MGVRPRGQERLIAFSEEDIVTPSEGFQEHNVQRTLENEYGISSYVVKKSAWSRNAPAYANNGVVYIREGINLSKNRDVAGHEATHAMGQLKYAPYLEFLERTPSMIDMSSVATRKILSVLELHCEEDIVGADEENSVRVYDELNAAMYEAYVTGSLDKDSASSVGAVFYDFDAYISELAAIHEQFKRDNTSAQHSGSDSDYSRKNPEDISPRAIPTDADEEFNKTELVDKAAQAMGRKASIEEYAAAYRGQDKAFLAVYNLEEGRQDPRRFAMQYELMHSYGVEGVRLEYVTSPEIKRLTGYLTPDQRELAYRIGRDARELGFVAGIDGGGTSNKTEAVTKGVLTNAKSGGIIKESNKNPITLITDIAINKVPKVNIDGFTDEQNTFIQNQHKDLLKYARDNNANKEVAFVFRKDLADRAVFVGGDDVIDFGNGLFGKGDCLFVMHNHPRNSSFSNADVTQLIWGDNIKYMSVVKNNGGVEVLSKTGIYDKRKVAVEWQRTINKYVSNGENSEYDIAMQKLLAKLNRKGYVKWIN